MFLENRCDVKQNKMCRGTYVCSVEKYLTQVKKTLLSARVDPGDVQTFSFHLKEHDTATAYSHFRENISVSRGGKSLGKLRNGLFHPASVQMEWTKALEVISRVGLFI